jgi:hypothetical protein
MSTTSWTQADLDAIEKAIASGALSVRYADKSVTYRTLTEMNTIRDQIRRALGKTSKTQRVYPSHSKGL